jgi:hypothetical protein
MESRDMWGKCAAARLDAPCACPAPTTPPPSVQLACGEFQQAKRRRLDHSVSVCTHPRQTVTEASKVVLPCHAPVLRAWPMASGACVLSRPRYLQAVACLHAESSG